MTNLASQSGFDVLFFPDVMAYRKFRDYAAVQFFEHPNLIVEVLSESTAAFGRGDKFAAYRTLPSLQEYVLVDIPSRRVGALQRTPDQDWLFHEHRSEDGEYHFPSLGVAISFDEIFAHLAPSDYGLGGQS